MVKLLSGVVFQIRAMLVGFLNKTPTQIKSRVIKLFILMVPYLNLIYIGIWVADRYVYFSSFCVLAVAVSARV